VCVVRENAQPVIQERYNGHDKEAIVTKTFDKLLTLKVDRHEIFDNGTFFLPPTGPLEHSSHLYKG